MPIVTGVTVLTVINVFSFQNINDIYPFFVFFNFYLLFQPILYLKFKLKILVNLFLKIISQKTKSKSQGTLLQSWGVYLYDVLYYTKNTLTPPTLL